jgi:hypothetical protein
MSLSGLSSAWLADSRAMSPALASSSMSWPPRRAPAVAALWIGSVTARSACAGPRPNLPPGPASGPQRLKMNLDDVFQRPQEFPAGVSESATHRDRAGCAGAGAQRVRVEPPTAWSPNGGMPTSAAFLSLQACPSTLLAPYHQDLIHFPLDPARAARSPPPLIVDSCGSG